MEKISENFVLCRDSSWKTHTIRATATLLKKGTVPESINSCIKIACNWHVIVGGEVKMLKKYKIGNELSLRAGSLGEREPSRIPITFTCMRPIFGRRRALTGLQLIQMK
jgi:hypothetical protein